MPFPSCFSFQELDQARSNHLQRLLPPSHQPLTGSPPSPPQVQAQAQSRVPGSGCIFCDVSKEKGFGVVYEDEELIAFHDRKPRAKIHLLIIPRYHIDSVRSLTAADIPLLDRMIALASTLTKNEPSRQGFHIPPFSSVGHLHMHVLVYPLKGLGRVKYPISKRGQGKEGKGWGWFVEVGQVRAILERGERVGLGGSD